MAKIFGGSASRAEVYGLFIAAVILVGGGVSGAIVLTSGADTPREAATTVVADQPLESTTTVVGGSGGTGTVETVPPSGSGGSTAVEPRTTVSIAGMTEEQAQIVREYVTRQTEAQRRAQVWADHLAFAAAHPVARSVSTEILSCTPVPLYDQQNPGVLIEILQLVAYRVTFEAVYEVYAGSYINPGLSVYGYQSGQDLLDGFSYSWQREPLMADFGVGPGVYSMDLYGMLLPSGGPPHIEISLSPVDNTYGTVGENLPLPGAVCG